jgi:hypothetical protein
MISTRAIDGNDAKGATDIENTIKRRWPNQ